MGVFVCVCVVSYPGGYVARSSTSVTGITSRARKLINHQGFEVSRDRVFERKNVFYFKRGED